MLATIQYKEQSYSINLHQALDISIPLNAGVENVNCFYAPLVEISPVVAGDFIGDVQQGGLVNFKNVKLNPHGNGTHTECVGHLSAKPYILDHCLKHFFFKARLISIYPTLLENGDRLITLRSLETLLEGESAETLPEALIIRTLPNDLQKHQQHYSGTNPTYLDPQAAQWMVDLGVQHLLIDLPSVDREEDGGKLLAHRAFWQYFENTAPEDIREHCTITELIYVPNEIKDGDYFLNIQITSLQMDASPSKPVLFKIES